MKKQTVTALKHLPELLEIRNQCPQPKSNGDEPNPWRVLKWVQEHCDKLQSHGCLDDDQDMPSLLHKNKLRGEQLQLIKQQVNKELNSLINLL